MIMVIITLAVVIALIIGFGVSGNRSISVTALTSTGNIGQGGILGCTFEPDIQLGSIEIRWTKEGVAGLVHEFKSGNDHLQDQDPMFRGRTAMFAEQVMGGNASLELRDVQLSDAGTYQCSVTTARGSGVAVLWYRTGAFSTPKVHMESSSSGDTLQCEAARWFPQPAVHWTACSDSGQYLPRVANTSYELNTENITLKVVSFLHNITDNVTYTCVIENNIAKATGNIKVTGEVYTTQGPLGEGEKSLNSEYVWGLLQHPCQSRNRLKSMACLSLFFLCLVWKERVCLTLLFQMFFTVTTAPLAEGQNCQGMGRKDTVQNIVRILIENKPTN
ncbi:V-set domain-containing T-cell activation inhibitor 1 isoform X3 [Heliangelus exortis]